MQFQIASRYVRGSIKEFLCNTDGTVFLEKELVGFGVDWYQ